MVNGRLIYIVNDGLYIRHGVYPMGKWIYKYIEGKWIYKWGKSGKCIYIPYIHTRANDHLTEKVLGEYHYELFDYSKYS